MKIRKLFFSLSSLEKIALVGAIAVFFLSASVKTALFIQANTAIVPAYGGEFIEGIVGQPVFINPIMPVTAADEEISKLVFGNLAQIAADIKHSDNGKTWNVRLKQDVLWQDGEPVTSDDVIFTLKTIQNRTSHSPLYASFQGVAATRLSALEIQFDLQSPYALFAEENLKAMSVIPGHIFGDLPVENFKLSIYGLNPIGFGPYKVASYDKNSRGAINAFYLRANDSYFAGKPHIARFKFKFYKNGQALADAYNNGQIDGFGSETSYNLLQSASGEPAKNSDLPAINVRHATHTLNYSAYYALFINQAISDKNLNNVKVREALSKGVNEQTIANNIFGDYAKPMYGPVSSTPRDTADFDKAVLNGVNLTVTVPDRDFLVRTANELKSVWEASGAKITLDVEPLDKISQMIKTTNYESLLFGNVLGPSGDMFSFWHSSQRFDPGQNLSLYQNRKIDALIETFGLDFDPKNRVEELRRISDLIAKDYPAVFLYSPKYIYVTIPGLKGFDDGLNISSPLDRFSDIENWYLNTERVF